MQSEFHKKKKKEIHMLQIIIALATVLLFNILSMIYVILKLRKCKNNFEDILYLEYNKRSI